MGFQCNLRIGESAMSDFFFFFFFLLNTITSGFPLVFRRFTIIEGYNDSYNIE